MKKILVLMALIGLLNQPSIQAMQADDGNASDEGYQRDELPVVRVESPQDFLVYDGQGLLEEASDIVEDVQGYPDWAFDEDEWRLGFSEKRICGLPCFVSTKGSAGELKDCFDECCYGRFRKIGWKATLAGMTVLMLVYLLLFMFVMYPYFVNNRCN